MIHVENKDGKSINQSVMQYVKLKGKKTYSDPSYPSISNL